MVIEDGCIIESSLLCSGAVVKNHSSLHKGTVIGFNVIVKGHTDIPSATLCTTFEGATTSAVSEDQEDPSKFLEKGRFYPSFGLDEES